MAGAVLALTPVAALMFRFNNPDSLLVLLLIAGAYFTVRATESGSLRWLSLVGVMVGFGFLTKMLQALLVVPAFALVYLIAAPNPIRTRIWHLLVAGAAMVFSAGWWIAIVSLVPAADRPYIGGSQHNSILELTLGYNGFGRLTGNETGRVGGGGAGGNNGGGMWGATGWNRLFGSEMGGQISWLLPTALLLLVAGLWFGRKAVRVDAGRAALILWGGWLLVTGAVFSFAKGIIHPYYTVALAPAIGAVIGIGAVGVVAPARRVRPDDLLLAVIVGAAWQFVLLDRTPPWLPWLRYSILMVGRGHRSAAVDGRGWPPGRHGGGPGGAAGQPGRAGCLRRFHRRHAAHRLHPERRTVRAATTDSAAAGGGGRAAASAEARRGGARRHASGWTRRRPRGTRSAAAPALEVASAGGGAGGLLEREHTVGGLGRRPEGRLVQVHLGRGSGRLQHRGRLPTGDREAGDADRWLQRQRPVADAGAVQGAGGGRQDPLLHRRRRLRRPTGRQQRLI